MELIITKYTYSIWARSVCMNESIEKGSMLPLINEAQKNKMSVIVMNPNLNRDSNGVSLLINLQLFIFSK